MKSLFNLQLGDSLLIAGQEYDIAGYSSGTYSSANPVFFVLKKTLQKSLSLQDSFSYLLVDINKQTQSDTLKEEILKTVDQVNVLDHEQFVANDQEMATQMGAETILIMTLISSALATLIICYTCYTLTVKKQSEIAIIKAVGGKYYQIISALVLQSLIITISAYLLAITLLLFLKSILTTVAPQLTIFLTTGLFFKPVPLTLMITLVGTLYPAVLILRLDPANAYKTR